MEEELEETPPKRSPTTPRSMFLIKHGKIDDRQSKIRRQDTGRTAILFCQRTPQDTTPVLFHFTTGYTVIGRELTHAAKSHDGTSTIKATIKQTHPQRGHWMGTDYEVHNHDCDWPRTRSFTVSIKHDTGIP
jgi:hypothetical protein